MKSNPTSPYLYLLTSFFFFSNTTGFPDVSTEPHNTFQTLPPSGSVPSGRNAVVVLLNL